MKKDAAGDRRMVKKTTTKNKSQTGAGWSSAESLPNLAEPVWEPPLNWKSILSDDRQALEAPGR